MPLQARPNSLLFHKRAMVRPNSLIAVGKKALLRPNGLISAGKRAARLRPNVLVMPTK